MKRIAGRCHVAFASALLIGCALAGCGGGGASGGISGGGAPPGGIPSVGSSEQERLVVGDGAGTIWAYVLHGEAPFEPTHFAVANLEMNGGTDYLVTLGKNVINAIEPETFFGESTVDRKKIRLSGTGDGSVTGIATDSLYTVYAAVGNAVLAFDPMNSTTQPFATIPIPNGPATGTIAIANDLSVAVQTGTAGPHGKATVMVFNPVTQGGSLRATVRLPAGSLGDPMAYDIQGRLLVDHANLLDAYTITTTTGALTGRYRLPSGPETVAVDNNNEIYTLTGPANPTQGQTATITAYFMTNLHGGLKKAWSVKTPFPARWLALAP